MSKFSRSAITLSDKKRRLLEALLQKEGVGSLDNQRITRRKADEALPLSFAQQRLWFLDQLEPGSSLYNLPAVVRLTGRLSVKALEQAFTAIIRRHEVLRTSFAKIDGQPRQIISPPQPIKLPVIDLTGIPEEEREAEAMLLIERETQKPFDLSRGPLLRISLIRIDDLYHIALLTIHHIVSDGWSMAIFIREMAAFYDSFSKGLPYPLDELPVQYADFALWQQQYLTGERLDRQLSYWREQLERAPAVLELPTDRPRPPAQSHRGASCPVELSQAASERLKALGGSEETTLFMTLLAGFSVLLYRYSGQSDVVVGTPTAGRNRSEIEGLIGFFVNLLVIRTDLAGEPSFKQLLARVKEVTLGAYAHQDVPFEKLVDELQPARDLSHTPLFQVSFTLESAMAQAMKLSGLTLDQVDVDNKAAKFDMTLILVDTEQGLTGHCEYSTDLFEDSTIVRMMRHFQTLLEAASLDPLQPITELPLLNDAERHQLLVAWNDTKRDYPDDKCIHQLFEEQVKRTPEAVALIFEGESLTYDELNRRANRLAHLLQQSGARPGLKVGVFLDRSPEMVIGVLAITKAGGAYVPVDTAWPVDRIHWIFSSLEIDCVITQRRYLRAIHDLQWRLPSLRDVICMDVDEIKPPPEPLNANAVRELWDHVAGQAIDRVGAGGFVSSYTGEPFPEAEVDEYVSRVVNLAAPHTGPGKRVLEIGCGAGLIMFELAKKVGAYVGLDPSEQTQALNRERIAQSGCSNIRLLTGFADEIDSLEANSFDLVIIASTAQFFPGPIYTEQVLAKALDLLKPEGAILLADVMDARRKDQFRRSLIEFKSQNPEARTKTQLENELYFDEDFFHELKAELHQLDSVTTLQRERGFKNELGYRYDVILKKAAPRDRSAGAKVSHMKRLWTRWHLKGFSDESPRSTVDSDDIAYIIFTSGSTGVPKGVVIKHKTVVNTIDWVNRVHAVGPGDRLLFVTSLCFDLSVYDIFGILAAGGAIQIATRADLHDPQRLARMLFDHPITFWDSAPATLQQLVPFLSAARGAGGAGRLRLVLLSGDWIPLALPDQIRSVFANARVTSLGGATEASIWSNFYPVEAVEAHWASIPYGKPLQNARYHILDQHLTPCPIGVSGELYIGGDCLALGYTDPEQTAERFLPDLFSKAPGARLYRTGDRARYRADGNIEFLGRVDHQLKIRGFRIELGEIEVVLSSHPAVRDVVVIAREDAPGDKRLVAYVVAKQDQSAALNDLRSFLSQRVPAYMLPTAFVILDHLPLTPNGKVDRRALPAPDTARPGLEAAYAAPRTEMEQKIASIWQEVLHLEKVGIYDNFFDLGGYSLLVVRVHSKLQEAINRDISITDLFAYPTVSSLADFLSQGPDGNVPLQHSYDRAETRKSAIRHLRHREQRRKV